MIGKRADKMLTKLKEMAMNNDGYIKIDNTNGTFMPVSVEILENDCLSVAHYFEQNGDLVPDPEMTFIFIMDEWFPVHIYHSTGVFRRCLNTETRECNPGEMADQAAFARLWMQNIKNQQSL